MAKLEYQKKTCGRCGGSGHYSRCAMYGTICFKCHGRKTVLTPAGAKAAAAVTAFINANFTVTADAIKVGDMIRVDGGSYARTVTAIEPVEETHGTLDKVTNEVTWKSGFTFTYNKPVPGTFGKYSTETYATDSPIVRAVTGADWDRVVEFARTIKRGVTVIEAAEMEAAK